MFAGLEGSRILAFDTTIVFDCLSDRSLNMQCHARTRASPDGAALWLQREQTGHSFVEKFPEYFSDMPNPKDCNNGRIGEPCDDRFPCGSNTGGTLALYALEASTLALRCTRCEPLRRVSLTDCVHQDNQYWAENSAYNEGDRTWHTTLAAQTLEAPKRCKVC